MSEPLPDRFAQRLAGLSPGRRALIDRLRGDRTPAPRRVIPRLPPASIAPLSHAQQRVWLLEQLSPGTPAHTMDSLLHVHAPYNIPALQAAVNEVVRRHDILRTTIRLQDGEPAQVIATTLDLRLPVVDLRHVPAAAREAEGIRLAGEDAREPFDLAAGPLVRVKLFRLEEDDYLFLVTMHHIVSDYVSMVVFFDELVAAYRACAAGLRPSLPEVPLQYADFAVWQREQVRNEIPGQQLAYWREQLAGLRSVQLPTDRPRPMVASMAGATHTACLQGELRDRVRAFSQAQGVTPFTTLLAAFNVLLWRYTGQTDLAVGVPVAGRSLPELQRVMGCFVNHVVMRTDLSGDPAFRDLVMHVARTVTEGLAHQDVPFEALVEDFQPVRRLNQNPLFQIAFQLLSLKHSTLIAPRVWLDRGTAALDLAVELIDSPEGITIRAEYATSLFDADTIGRMIRHYQELLDGLTAHPDAAVSAAEMMTLAERECVLHEWSRGPITSTADLRPTHRLVEAQTARAPEAIAVIADEQRRTYAELNQQANRLAHQLRAAGVRADTLAVLVLPRSFDLYAAMLATWKAGGAFLSFDPDLPSRRIETLLTDARPAVIVSHAAIAARLPACGAAVIAADEPPKHDDDGEPPWDVSLDDLAYVIYTSGSTGRPKGVMVSHRAIAHQLQWMQQRCPLDARDTVLQKYSTSFDASLIEIFGTLTAGARLVAVDSPSSRDPARLARMMADHDVTVLDAVPSQLALLIDEPAFPRRLRRVVSGGEPLPADLLARLRQSGVGQILNMYGPTEATITALWWADDGRALTAGVPIGRPIDNMSAYVVDERGTLLPPGVPGELYLGGIGLARGYVGPDALTARSFVANPFDVPDVPRLYATGDRVRWSASGELQYVGRADRQVKVRGIRTDPEEVESVLREHALAAACAVLPDSGDGEPRLRAWVVPADRVAELWPSVGEYFVYDELLYHAMASDRGRNDAYRCAIQRVASGKTVADLGTGADALWARACIDAGARRVYAIEMLEEAARAASALVARLGLDDRITVMHGDARAVSLPEPVDVIVSELIGTIGSSEGAAPILNQARQLLAPGGVMIPERCVTRIAAVELPAGMAEYPSFSEVSGHYVGRVFERSGGPHDLRVCIKGATRDHLLSDAAAFEELDFRGPVPLGSRRAFTLTFARDGLVHGLLLWIQLEPGGEITIDTLEGGYSWLPVFFPIFDSGLRVKSGDRIEGLASVIYPGERLTPDYEIVGQLMRAGQQPIAFDHSSRVGGSAFRRTPFYQRLFHQDGTPRSDGLLSAPALRAWLAQRLPDHMIPSSFTLIDHLPRAASGKLDVEALAASGGPPRNAYVAPRSDLERTLASAWEAVLGIDRAGLHDNFFDLGGHSLLLVRLQRRLRERHDLDVSLIDLFQAPTIQTLATLLHLRQATSVAT